MYSHNFGPVHNFHNGKPLRDKWLQSNKFYKHKLLYRANFYYKEGVLSDVLTPYPW